jgi:hypothetical protein
VGVLLICAPENGRSCAEDWRQPRREDVQVDPFGAHLDLLDQGWKQRTHLRRRQRRPATRDLGGAINQVLLTGRVQPKLLGSFKDAVRLGEKLAKPIGDELLDLRGRDSQPAGRPGAGLRDQRMGDVVAVAPALLDRMGRGHAVAVSVEQQARE